MSLACLLVVAFLGANLASYVHQATQRHARCAEHGETIHVVDNRATTWDAATWDAAARERLTGEPEPNIHPYAPATGSHEHEHCYSCPTSRAHESAADQVGSADAIFAVIGPRITRQHTPGHKSALYTLAPKTSPPV